MSYNFSLYELSPAEMKGLGLIDEYGDLTIEPEDLKVLLTGRRTGLLRLRDLSADGMYIAEMEAKLRLYRDREGKAILRIHPVCHQPRSPFAWDDAGARRLIEGRQLHLRYLMETAVPPGETIRSYEYILEYDAETREFISYEPGDISAPDRVNGFELSPSQKNLFGYGIPVSLPDGTELIYKATESQGLLANREALILSTDTDDGRTYDLREGIQALNSTYLTDENVAFENEYAAMVAESEPVIRELITSSRKKGR